MTMIEEATVPSLIDADMTARRALKACTACAHPLGNIRRLAATRVMSTANLTILAMAPMDLEHPMAMKLQRQSLTCALHHFEPCPSSFHRRRRHHHRHRLNHMAFINQDLESAASTLSLGVQCTRIAPDGTDPITATRLSLPSPAFFRLRSWHSSVGQGSFDPVTGALPIFHTYWTRRGGRPSFSRTCSSQETHLSSNCDATGKPTRVDSLLSVVHGFHVPAASHWQRVSLCFSCMMI